MRTKVYTYKPKGRGTSYITKTDHSRRGMGGGSSSSRYSKKSGGVMSDFVSGGLARLIVRGLFGSK